ncbi:Kelch-like protein 18 [Toxocara canis]|uniref:Kelch-like protein 18 n=1 Tax=Toxocara canis TaxID=6265 RepID=A0A0B2VDV5_TOXCA|nr:Kelch-like protein 18 [Toxocara canis]
MCDEDDEEAVVFECGASLAASAFPNFDEIRRAGKLCDIVLIANGLSIAEFDADTLEQLIAFAYTGRVRITSANVQSMMQAANFLQLNSIVDECCRFLQCRLQSQNVLGIRSFAMALGCISLVLSAGNCYFLQQLTAGNIPSRRFASFGYL